MPIYRRRRGHVLGRVIAVVGDFFFYYTDDAELDLYYTDDAFIDPLVHSDE